MPDSFPFLRLPVELQIKILKFSFGPYWVSVIPRKLYPKPPLHIKPEDFEYNFRKIAYRQPFCHFLNALLVSPDTYEVVQEVLQKNPVVLHLAHVREWARIDSRATMRCGVLPMLSKARFKTIRVIDLGGWYSEDMYLGRPSPSLSDLLDTSRLPDLESVSLAAWVDKEDFNLFDCHSRIPELLSGQHDETIFVGTMRDSKYDWRPKLVTNEVGYLVSAKGRVIPIEVCARLFIHQLLPTMRMKCDNYRNYGTYFVTFSFTGPLKYHVVERELRS
ncbi:hypothetical protein LTR70_008103 [Exophiala xenobiotica]|uniref:Uncharacterized protein n=1 Tax=Lithohypha guttulata TaxID=1690604 RepID=A0ABR0K2B8_9EURO|nr:hypothetical protein LTR24_007612 [Lithohypha guttulata]KAK5312580.1 hypothetical protein LTR70_008103 [Exophiala xenobiotica]